MARYVVKTPWHGVKSGDIIVTGSLHPAIAKNVELLPEPKAELPAPELVVATPKKTRRK